MWFEHSDVCAATEIPTEPSTRDNSSMTVAYSTYPRPAPPYSSGKITPIKPSSASFGFSSMGKCCVSSHSLTCGAISLSANSRTLIFICCCSSLSSNSIVSQNPEPFLPLPPLGEDRGEGAQHGDAITKSTLGCQAAHRSTLKRQALAPVAAIKSTCHCNLTRGKSQSAARDFCLVPSIRGAPMEFLHFCWGQPSPRSILEFRVGQRPDAHPQQLRNRMANRIKHPANLLVAAFMKR